MATREVINEFDPVKYSNAENEFLLGNLGKPTVVALREAGSVNPRAVRPILDRVNELNQLQEHNNEGWVGVEALKNAIRVWLRESGKWASDRRRNRVRFPSMAAYDAKGRPHRQGPGSDNGQVRTYFGPAGERIPFKVDFFPLEKDWSLDTPYEEPLVPGALRLINDAAANRIECPVCKHTESYKAESRASYSAARARMSKHLRSTPDLADQHRELHTLEFN